MRVELWTDGGCYPNPGPGAWAFVLVAYERVHARSPYWRVIAEMERSGKLDDTTNQRAELEAVVRGLRAVRRPSSITVNSDSAYVVNSMLREDPKRWTMAGWRGSTGKPIKNRDLWAQLLAVSRQHKITWRLVRGHTGVKYNERCDALCTAAYREAA